MKKVMTVLIMVALVAMAANVVANNGPAEVTLEAKPGTVTFKHADHQTRVADCTSCHHNGVEQGACRTCHDGSKAPKFKDAAHKLCKDCHKKSNGPTKCKDCHVK